MKQLTPECTFGGCPNVFDPEDGTDDIFLVGTRVTQFLRAHTGTGEEAIRMPRKLVLDALLRETE